jgi:hypothetical protein
MDPNLTSLFHGSPSICLWRSTDDTPCPRRFLPLYLGREILALWVFVKFRMYSCLPHLPDHYLFSLQLHVLAYSARNIHVKILRYLCFLFVKD